VRWSPGERAASRWVAVNVRRFADPRSGQPPNSRQLNDKGCFEDERKCWDEVNLINKQIFSYNNFVRTCASRK
jgi:hypothetical protein